MQASDSRTKVQAFDIVAVPSFPAPSQFLGPNFTSCQSFVPNSQGNYNAYEFCDPQFDGTVRRALTAQAAASPTDDAPVVNLVTPSITDFVSRRVGNYQYNPQLGVLIDQLWVR